MSEHAHWKDLLAAAISDAHGANRQMILEPTGKSILAACGVDVPFSFTVSSDEPLESVAEKLTFPVVLKVISDQIVHKSDVGGVALDLNTLVDLNVARDSMIAVLSKQGYVAQQFLIEEMVPRGLEMVVGGIVDPEFGPMVMVGLGGVFVEVTKDISFGICPIDRFDALEMIDDLRGRVILDGVRGREPVNKEAIVQTLLAVGGYEGLLTQFATQISEIDINPLIVTSSRAYAADARLVLRRAR